MLFVQNHKMWYLFLFYLFLYLYSSFAFGALDCKTTLNRNLTSSKIYFDVFNWEQPVYTPGIKSETLTNGDLVNFECANGFVRNNLIGKSYTFQCTNGKYNKTYPFEELLCRSNYHKHTLIEQIASKNTRSKIFKCDSADWNLYKISTIQPNGSSKLVYMVCLDTKVMRPKYVFQPSQNEAPPKRGVYEERNDIWGFDGYGKSVNEMRQISQGYVQKIQKTHTTNNFHEKYKSKGKQYPYYFNRGHLAPYSDFNEADERKATCQYLNAAPQWEDFNKNQWSLVEKEARSIRQTNPKEWEVYTGTYGKIPTTKSGLFLAPIFEHGVLKKALLPVPMLYWKLVYNVNDETKSKAFVGVNNPEIKSPNEIVNKYKICTPLRSTSGALFEGSEFFGFTYTCKIDEFLRALKNEEKIIKESYVF